MSILVINLLGPFQVTLGGEPASGFDSDKVRALMAYLVVEADRPHRREALAGLLWPEWDERGARTNLRWALANLRQVIGDRVASPLCWKSVAKPSTLIRPASTNNPRPLSAPHPCIMIGDTGPKKAQRMVAQYADACNIGDWVGDENMQKALDTLKAHCDNLGRDYDTVEKTSLCTVNLSGDNTAVSIINRIKELSQMGFTHAIFNMPDVYKITPLETFAKEVIPVAADL